jgi:2'-5' RNA ligase
LGATVGGDERIRLFLALRLPDDALDAIVAWQLRELGAGRIVPREHLHVTLAFLGRRPAAELPAIVAELRTAAAAARPMRFAVDRYRETRSVGMLVLRDETGAAAVMAADLHDRLERLGVYRREARAWLPHATVLRFRERAGLRPGNANIRTIVPSDAAAYLSRLAPSGARYEVLESVALGG